MLFRSGLLVPLSGMARAAAKSWGTLHLVSSQHPPPLQPLQPTHLSHLLQEVKDSFRGRPWVKAAVSAQAETLRWARHEKPELVVWGP